MKYVGGEKTQSLWFNSTSPCVIEQLLCGDPRGIRMITGRQKEGCFVKGWFGRMCPRSGFRSGGTCEHTLVPAFVLGEHANVPSFRFFVPGEHLNVPSFRFSFRGGRPRVRQNHPFGKPPFCQAPKRMFHSTVRKILAPVKIKSALHPPPQKNKPQNEEFYGHGGFPAERRHFFQVSVKLAQPFPAPELRTRILRTRGFF